MTCQPCAATSGQLTQPPTRLMHQDITSPDRELGYRVWRWCAERVLRSALLRIMLICLCGRVVPSGGTEQDERCRGAMWSTERVPVN